MKIPNNHISLQLSHDVDQICKPLYQLGLSYFNHVRFYKETGSMTSLINNPKWHLHFMEKEYPCKIDMITGAYLWADVLPKEALTDAHNLFNMPHVFELDQQAQDYYDIFAFGASPKMPSIMSFCMSNLDLFYKFIDYFKDKSSIIFKKSDQNRVIVSSIKVSPQIELSTSEGLKKMRRNFYENMGIHDPFTEFSPRELDCLYHSARGKSARQVGGMLDISRRTVETYLESAKLKANCYAKSQLIELYLAHYLKAE